MLAHLRLVIGHTKHCLVLAVALQPAIRVPRHQQVVDEQVQVIVQRAVSERFWRQ